MLIKWHLCALGFTKVLFRGSGACAWTWLLCSWSMMRWWRLWTWCGRQINAKSAAKAAYGTRPDLRYVVVWWVKWDTMSVGQSHITPAVDMFPYLIKTKKKKTFPQKMWCRKILEKLVSVVESERPNVYNMEGSNWLFFNLILLVSNFLFLIF